MNRTLMILMFIALGYVIGAKWPGLLQKIGLA